MGSKEREQAARAEREQAAKRVNDLARELLVNTLRNFTPEYVNDNFDNDNRRYIVKQCFVMADQYEIESQRRSRDVDKPKVEED